MLRFPKGDVADPIDRVRALGTLDVLQESTPGGVDLLIVGVGAMAATAGLPDFAARFAEVETMASGEIGSKVIAALTWIQEKPEYPAITAQLAMVAMNLKNLK